MYIFIINKRAGAGKAATVLEAIKMHPLYQQEQCRNYVTNYPGHAEKLSQQLASLYGERIKCILVVGGDGTVHEVINGLRNHPNIPITCIPVGSGNDFARGYGVKGDPIEIFKRVVSSESRRKIWSGFYWTSKREDRLKRLFVNSISFGFDAEVAAIANRSAYKKWLNKWRIGSLTYVIALLQVVRKYKPLQVVVELDGKRKKLENVLMMTVSNHPYYGGGMKIMPNAKIRPTVLPILIIQDLARWKIPLLFFTVFLGKHVRLKEVKIFYASSVFVESSSPMYMQVDGQTGTCQTCWMEKDAMSREISGTIEQ